MKYMTCHNKAHSRKVVDLAVKLHEAESHTSYRKLVDMIACFEQGNAMLAEVLKEMVSE